VAIIWPRISARIGGLTIYVIDVAGGDKIPRKAALASTQSDLLVINKTDLASAVGADLSVMERDAKKCGALALCLRAGQNTRPALKKSSIMFFTAWQHGANVEHHHHLA